jgi:hypothetical protein
MCTIGAGNLVEQANRREVAISLPLTPPFSDEPISRAKATGSPYPVLE